MGYFFGRIWAVAAFFISLAIGAFLADSVGLGNDIGFTLGCIIGVIIWAAVPPLIASFAKQNNAQEDTYLRSKLEQPPSNFQPPKWDSRNPSITPMDKDNIVRQGSGIVFCHKCGKRALPNDEYCTRCGVKLHD